MTGRAPRLASLTAVVVLAVVGLAAAGCGADADGGAPGGGDAIGGTVTVFAAASLTETFTRLGRSFEDANPGTTVTLNFAGSSALAAQIGQGAPVDVFASAAPGPMKTVTDAGATAGAPATFVRNRLVIAVPRGNPKRIAGLADLSGPDVKLAMCAEQVPCGASAVSAAKAAGVTLQPATLERDVKAALAKLRLGEVDAALVYRTDVRAAGGDVSGVEFPESAGAVNEYPIAVLKDAPNPAAARAFVDHVRSAEGMKILTDAGFQAP